MAYGNRFAEKLGCLVLVTASAAAWAEEYPGHNGAPVEPPVEIDLPVNPSKIVNRLTGKEAEGLREVLRDSGVTIEELTLSRSSVLSVRDIHCQRPNYYSFPTTTKPHCEMTDVESGRRIKLTGEAALRLSSALAAAKVDSQPVSFDVSAYRANRIVCETASTTVCRVETSKF